MKRQQWTSLAAVGLIGVVVWSIYKTDFLAGFWGILDDEIAVVTIERDKDGNSNVTIKDPSKSFWDGLGLLGVPLVLAVLGAWFQKTQQEQSERIAKEQRDQDGDETREEVLQLYFDRVSALLIDKNLMAIATKKEETEATRAKGVLAISIDTKQEELLEVAIDVIRARTLSILRRFEQDPERKSSVVRFLIEADVISRLGISLSRANLTHASLRGAHLRFTNLRFADLRGADLRRADLRNTDLRRTDLRGADLRGTDLRDANLRDANLRSADFRDANLRDANLRSADFRDANLCGAKLSQLKLNDADFRDANLRDASLRSSKLIGTYLFDDTDLRDKRLFSVNVRNANVIDTKFGMGLGLSDEEISDLVRRGAIFDDGLRNRKSSHIPNP